jgi:hypothetical protein
MNVWRVLFRRILYVCVVGRGRSGVALHGIRDSGARGIGDFDVDIRQAPHLDCSHEQQKEYRQYQGELYKGLPNVLADGNAMRYHHRPPFPETL